MPRTPIWWFTNFVLSVSLDLVIYHLIFGRPTRRSFTKLWIRNNQSPNFPFFIHRLLQNQYITLHDQSFRSKFIQPYKDNCDDVKHMIGLLLLSFSLLIFEYHWCKKIIFYWHSRLSLKTQNGFPMNERNNNLNIITNFFQTI